MRIRAFGVAAGRAVHGKTAMKGARKTVSLDVLGDVTTAPGLMLMHADGAVNVHRVRGRPLQDAGGFVFDVPLSQGVNQEYMKRKYARTKVVFPLTNSPSKPRTPSGSFCSRGVSFAWLTAFSAVTKLILKRGVVSGPMFWGS
jgi:hypothetical protein